MTDPSPSQLPLDAAPAVLIRQTCSYLLFTSWSRISKLMKWLKFFSVENLYIF